MGHEQDIEISMNLIRAAYTNAALVDENWKSV